MVEFLTLIGMYYLFKYIASGECKKQEQLRKLLKKHQNKETFNCDREELSWWSDEEIKTRLNGKFSYYYEDKPEVKYPYNPEEKPYVIK